MINPLLTKLFWSRWLNIVLCFFICVFITETKKRTWPISSRLQTSRLLNSTGRNIVTTLSQLCHNFVITLLQHNRCFFFKTSTYQSKSERNRKDWTGTDSLVLLILLFFNSPSDNRPCTDKRKSCSSWARSGYCKDRRYAVFMAINCKKTCNKC